MTRDQIIYECGKTAGRATRPAPPAMDDPGPFLDDEGRAMVGTSHHYTADNIRALVAEYKALESGAPEALERYSNSDHRTRAGVLWRVISALADEVPFAPAMDGGEDAARWRAWAGAMVEACNAPGLNPDFILALSTAVGEAEIPITLEQLNAWTDAARAAQKEGDKP